MMMRMMMMMMMMMMVCVCVSVWILTGRRDWNITQTSERLDVAELIHPGPARPGPARHGPACRGLVRIILARKRTLNCNMTSRLVVSAAALSRQLHMVQRQTASSSLDHHHRMKSPLTSHALSPCSRLKTCLFQLSFFTN